MKFQYPITSIILLLLVWQQFFHAAGRSVVAQHQEPKAPSSNTTSQQTPPAPSKATQATQDDVVRITTNLVQIDAVVTDKNGKRVEDLQAEDFEVIVNGRKQSITNLSYNSYKLTNLPNAPRVEADNKVLSVRPKSPDQVRRTIAFVVDNLCTSAESTHQARASLRKFINEDMQPNDLVAIIQTVGNTGLLQQFSTDKQFLLAAVNDIRRNISSTRRACESDEAADDGGQDPLALERSDPEQADNLRVSNEVVAARWNIFTSGRMGALNLILRGLRNVPGRKSLVLLADTLPFPDLSKTRPDESSQYGELYRRLIDLANRASTVIYTVDLRGLPTLNVTALDNRAASRAIIEQRSRGGLLSARRANFFQSKTGMISLAGQTGGFFVDNTNDISSGLRRAADDSDGYYLIGFRPDDELFDPIKGRVRFNQFELKLKRPGLQVRTRRGFYGFTESGTPPLPSQTDRLLSALISPFGTAALNVNLFSIFAAESNKKQFVSSLIHIDGNSLKFTEEPDGWHQAKFNVLAVLFNADGIPVEHVNRIDTVRAKGATLERMLSNGIVYTLHVPVKKPGMYQLRAAVSDIATDKIGVSDQTIEVPDLGKDRLTLSNIVMRGTEASLGVGLSSGRDRIEMSAGISESNPLSNPAIRRFGAGSEIECYFYVYNARTSDPGLPALTTQLRLFRDDKLILAGKPGTIDKGKQTDLKRFLVGTRLTLGRDLPPGEYVLQVVVTEPGAKGKDRAATQSIDFTLRD